jgi:DNA polymerase-3 subunit epsilon
LEKPELHHLRLHMALAAQQLQVWPYPGRVALREHCAHSGRSDLHIFDQWCHLATVHDEAELEEALAAQPALAFDLDSYRLLLKTLGQPRAPRAGGLELMVLPRQSAPVQCPLDGQVTFS